jgi:hypothetical protein
MAPALVFLGGVKREVVCREILQKKEILQNKAIAQ